VVEDGLVVVFAGDHDELVPDAGKYDPLVVELDAEVFGIDRGERVAGAVHATAAIAAADDRDELVRLVVVVSGEELGQRLLRGSAAEKRDDLFAVTAPAVPRIVSPSPT
jgi:hypothetical protein